MADTIISSPAYDLLKKTLSEATATLTAAQKKLKDLQNDSNYLRDMAVLADPRVVNDNTAWINAQGIWWNNQQESSHANAQGRAYVSAIKSQIQTAQADVDTAQKKLNDATTAVSNYENTSPVVKAQVADQNNKKYLIIGGILLGLAILITLSIVFFSKKKQTPAAA